MRARIPGLSDNLVALKLNGKPEEILVSPAFQGPGILPAVALKSMEPPSCPCIIAP